METLVTYLNGHIPMMQNLEFFLRLIVACLCGVFIGLERTRRLKEAGVRTHIIVCCASALFMIVSKYGFADLTSIAGVAYDGTRGADPARVAAQVVSGISFLGAGVIFKNGGSIRGLTTAAGIWATGGIGLALGAGMYTVGVFMTALILVLQALLHKYAVGRDHEVERHIKFTVENTDAFREAWRTYIAERHLLLAESSLTYLDDGYVTYSVVAWSPREFTMDGLDEFLRTHSDVRFASCSTVG